MLLPLNWYRILREKGEQKTPLGFFSDFPEIYEKHAFWCLFPIPRSLLAYTSSESQLHLTLVWFCFLGLWPVSLPDEVFLEMDVSCETLSFLSENWSIKLIKKLRYFFWKFHVFKLSALWVKIIYRQSSLVEFFTSYGAGDMVFSFLELTAARVNSFSIIALHLALHEKKLYSPRYWWTQVTYLASPMVATIVISQTMLKIKPTEHADMGRCVDYLFCTNLSQWYEKERLKLIFQEIFLIS